MSTFNHNDKFFVTSGGNIGVGVEAPNQDFHIKRDGSAPVIHLERINNNAGYLLLNGSINPSIAFDDGQNFRIATVSNSSFDNFSAKFTVKNNGNIGIGADDPSYKLQVQGSGYFNETLYVNGDTEINAKLLITDEHVVHKSSSPEFYFHTSGNHYNWMIAAQENVDGGLEFGHSSATATSLDTTASNYTRTLTLKSDSTSEFGGNVTINGGAGNTLLLKKGSGTPAVTFAGTAADPQASALIEGIAGGGLKIYTGASSGTISNPGWVSKMTMIQNGTTTFANSIIGENDNTTYGIIRSAKNIVSNSIYNLISMHSTRSIDDYGGLNKNYIQMNLVTPGASTTGGGSSHCYGNFSLKLATNCSNTNMNEVLNIEAGGTATFLNNVDATNFRSKANSSYSFTPNTTSKWQLNTPSGYLRLGPGNTSYAHIETDRDQFYFNKKLVVNSGEIQSYDENLVLRRVHANATITLGEDSNATNDGWIIMGLGEKKGLVMLNGSQYLTNYLHSVRTDAASPTHTAYYQWYTIKNPAGYSAQGLASSFKVKIYTAGKHANGSCYAEYLVRCHNANHQATSGLGNTEVFQLFKTGRGDGYGGSTQDLNWYVRNNLSGWNNGEIIFRVGRANREPIDTIKIEPIGADTSTDYMPTLVSHGGGTGANDGRPTTDIQEVTMQYAGLQRTGTADARLIIDADGAANGTAHEIARFVNTSGSGHSSYFYIGSTSGTDWRVGKNILGTTGKANFEIATHSGTTKALEINSSTLLSTFSGKIATTSTGTATIAAIQLRPQVDGEGLGISAPATDQMNFITADNTRMVIKSDGKVGIGTDSPGTGLEVASGAPMLRLRYNANYYTNYSTNSIDATGTNQTFTIQQNGANTLVFDASKNATFTGMVNVKTDVVKISTDGTYGGSYGTVAFGGISNGSNRVFGHTGTADGLFLASATGRGVFIRVNGAGSDTHSFGSNGYVGMGIVNTNNQRLTLAEADANGSHLKMNNSRSGGGYWVNGVGDSGSSSSIVPAGGIFWYNGATRMVIDSSGNVGIGTASPTGYKVVVHNSSEDLLKLHNTTDGLDSLISFTNPGGTLGRIQGIDNGGLGFDTGNNAGGINTNAMYIKNNAYVGIGNTDPQRPLSVKSNSDSPIMVESTDDTTGIIFKDNNSSNALYYRGNGNYFYTTSKFGIGTTSPDSKLEVITTGTNSVVELDNSTANYTITQYNAQGVTKGFSGFNTSFMVFGGESGVDTRFTAGGQYGLTIRNSDRNVGIGTTDPQSKLHVSGANTVGRFVSSTSYVDLIFTNSGGTGGFLNFVNNTAFNLYVGGGSGSDLKMSVTNGGLLTVTGDVVAFGSPSDASLKENVKPIDNALDKVTKLKGVTFDWKQSDSILDIKEDIGFIAQDVRGVLPELVRKNKDGKLSLRDKGIIPVLVEAIKELKAEIEELKCKCDGCTK